MKTNVSIKVKVLTCIGITLWVYFYKDIKLIPSQLDHSQLKPPSSHTVYFVTFMGPDRTAFSKGRAFLASSLRFF